MKALTKHNFDFEFYSQGIYRVYYNSPAGKKRIWAIVRDKVLIYMASEVKNPTQQALNKLRSLIQTEHNRREGAAKL